MAVYKSCNKTRENDLLRRELGSYAQIVEPADSNFNQDANIYPPPPPPYGFATSATNPLPERTNTDNLTHAAPNSINPPPAGFKPEFAQATTTTNQPNSSASSSNTESNISWGSFLSGAAVGGVTGYLLNRRK